MSENLDQRLVELAQQTSRGYIYNLDHEAVVAMLEEDTTNLERFLEDSRELDKGLGVHL